MRTRGAKALEAQLAGALATVLQPVLVDTVTVENLRALTGGASRTTWAFDAIALVAAVADFLDNDVRSSTKGQVNFHARVAANVLRIVERELTDDSAAEVAGRLAELGFADEAQLAAAIRAGILDDRAADVLPTCARWSAIGWRSLTPAMTNLQDWFDNCSNTRRNTARSVAESVPSQRSSPR